jgi:branched-subunit amino acid aminotransferase/4-amino-4-deoxychorismate lyase
LTAIEHGADIALLFEEDILVDGDRCAPLLLDHDGVAYHPRHSDGALDSVTIEQIRPGLEAAGIPVRPAKLTLNMILRASEMVVCGSGMGIRAIGSIDGRTIGTPRSRLFQAATDAWLSRLEVGWISAEDI